MAVISVPASYLRLVRKFPLASIRDAAHLHAAQAMLGEVLALEPDAGTDMYLDALSDLIEHHESGLEPLGDAPEADVLRELMRSNGLTQEALEAKTGIQQSTISAVLNGKRSLTKEQILILADHFALSPSAFLPGRPKSTSSAKGPPGRTG